MNYEGPLFLLQFGTKYHRNHAIARMIPSQPQLQSATDTRHDCFDCPCEKSPCWCPGSRVYPKEEWRWTGTAGLRNCFVSYRLCFVYRLCTVIVCTSYPFRRRRLSPFTILSRCKFDSLFVKNIILTIETSQNNHNPPRWSDIAVRADVEIDKNRQKLLWFCSSRLFA
jgi:hypothetical protein